MFIPLNFNGLRVQLLFLPIIIFDKGLKTILHR